MRRLALAAMSLTLLAACQPETTQLTEAERAEIADTVNALHSASWDAWRAVDLDRALSYLDSSSDLWWAEGGQVLHGYAEVDSHFREASATVSSFNITITDSRTLVLAADAVAVLQQGRFSVTDSAGVTSPEQSFVMSATWVQRSGEWKVLYGHESYPAPESESM
jgi:hypothetical protein